VLDLGVSCMRCIEKAMGMDHYRASNISSSTPKHRRCGAQALQAQGLRTTSNTHDLLRHFDSRANISSGGQRFSLRSELSFICRLHLKRRVFHRRYHAKYLLLTELYVLHLTFSRVYYHHLHFPILPKTRTASEPSLFRSHLSYRPPAPPSLPYFLSYTLYHAP